MFKYEDNFLKIFVEELYLISQQSGGKISEFSKKAIQQWINKPDLKSFRKWINRIESKTTKDFVVADLKKIIQSDFYEIIVIRLQKLLSFFDNFSLFYDVLDKHNPNFCDEYGVDLNIRETFVLLLRSYLQIILDDLIKIDPSDKLEYMKSDLIELISEAILSDTNKMFVEYVYDIDETLSDCIDEIDDDGFWYIENQLDKANEFIKFIIQSQTFIYYAILVVEILEFDQLLNVGIFDFKNKLYVAKRMQQIDWDLHFDEYMRGKKVGF
ncbi:hypothetical protein VQY18_02930 [Mycoplasma feriruminatoris]|uniref:Uncharacterized protein n=1 Tax=Mycoplasma feriruminatoris TaxID=1179777 RepID=A0A654IQL8_9MOLU|nr:hypothetical protein MF5583_00590 [Mycoplasma feriruminatoris]